MMVQSMGERGALVRLDREELMGDGLTRAQALALLERVGIVPPKGAAVEVIAAGDEVLLLVGAAPRRSPALRRRGGQF